jgi:hypothetical protein
LFHCWNQSLDILSITALLYCTRSLCFTPLT